MIMAYVSCQLVGALVAGRRAPPAGEPGQRGGLALLLLPPPLQGARREAAELREARLEAEAAHNRERLSHAGLLVRSRVACCEGPRQKTGQPASTSAHAQLLPAASLPTACMHPPTHPPTHSLARLLPPALRQAELEGLRTAVAREKHSREAQQRKAAELEASLRRWGLWAAEGGGLGWACSGGCAERVAGHGNAAAPSVQCCQQ